jgi:hypothetical protein
LNVIFRGSFAALPDLSRERFCAGFGGSMSPREGQVDAAIMARSA